MTTTDEPTTTMGKSLATMAGEVVAWCHRKGWEPDPARTFGDECALIHSEVSEALEAYRSWKFDDATADAAADHHDRLHGLCMHGELRGECDQFAQAKPEGVGSEFADILIRLLHYSATHGIDLEAEYERKMAYNERRPWRHGGRAL